MKTILFFLCTLVLFSGCSSPKHLPTPKDLKYHVKGFKAQVAMQGKFKNVTGEIIAVNDIEIIILPYDSKEHITTIAKNNISDIYVHVALTVNDPKKINTWASLLNITPLGHGVFGLITFPITVAATKGITSSKYSMKYPDALPWEKLSKFARFPQGIPAHIDIKSIK